MTKLPSKTISVVLHGSLYLLSAPHITRRYRTAVCAKHWYYSRQHLKGYGKECWRNIVKHQRWVERSKLHLYRHNYFMTRECRLCWWQKWSNDHIDDEDDCDDNNDYGCSMVIMMKMTMIRHACKKRVMLRRWLFWPKKICGKSA